MRPTQCPEWWITLLSQTRFALNFSWCWKAPASLGIETSLQSVKYTLVISECNLILKLEYLLFPVSSALPVFHEDISSDCSTANSHSSIEWSPRVSGCFQLNKFPSLWVLKAKSTYDGANGLIWLRGLGAAVGGLKDLLDARCSCLWVRATAD